MTSDLLVLRGEDVAASLHGQERRVVDAVVAAYLDHRAGDTVLPRASFLPLGKNGRRERIIALPAMLRGDAPIAGVKWIASFPDNVDRGMARASAVVVVNSTDTGRPRAMLEGSLISSSRTAASAAAAATALHRSDDTRLGVVGCGVINTAIARYVKVLMPRLAHIVACDLVPERARAFAARVAETMPGVGCEIVGGIPAVFASARLVSFATVATTPHVASLDGCTPDTTVLHISLRDLAPACITAADNVVDDVEHVLAANTSPHLAEQQLGHHRFIRCTLADVLANAAQPRLGDRPVVFSPFGLGILDMAVARLVLADALAAGRGARIADFITDEADQPLVEPQGTRRSAR